MNYLEEAEQDLATCEKRLQKANAGLAKAETRLEKELAQEAVTDESRRMRKAREHLDNCRDSAGREATENFQQSQHNEITKLLAEPYEIARAVYRAECVVNGLRQKCLEALQPYAARTNGTLPPLYPGVEAPEDRPRTFADVLRVGAKREGARLPTLLNDLMVMPLGQRWDDYAMRQEKYAEHDMHESAVREAVANRPRSEQKTELTPEEREGLKRVMESDLVNSAHGLTKLLTGIDDHEIHRSTFLRLAGLADDGSRTRYPLRTSLNHETLTAIATRLPTLLAHLDGRSPVRAAS